MKEIVLAVFCAILAATMASAAVVTCGTGTTNVTQPFVGSTPSNECQAGGLFLLFNGSVANPTQAGSVSISGGFTSGTVGIASSEVVGSQTIVDFTLSNLTPVNASGDIILLYTIIGGMTGIDQSWGGSVGTVDGSIRIIETACAVQFATSGSGCPEGQVLGTLTGTITQESPSFQGSAKLTRPSYVTYISKDIQFNGTGNAMSHFANSADIPEPGTLLLLGSALLGLGLVRRKRRS